MATYRLPIFISLSVIFMSFFSAAIAVVDAGNPDLKFVKTSCSAATLYPAVCVKSLSPFAAHIRRSPRRLITTAVALSISKARSTVTFVDRVSRSRGLRPRDNAALKDCLEEVSDGVDMLVKSLKEMKKLGIPESPDFQWHLSNVQTWISAALTDETTCLDGFPTAGRVKSEVQTRISYLAQVTSNALAICNNFAGKS